MGKCLEQELHLNIATNALCLDFVYRLCLYVVNFADFIGCKHYIGFIIQGEKTHFLLHANLAVLAFFDGENLFSAKGSTRNPHAVFDDKRNH